MVKKKDKQSHKTLKIIGSISIGATILIVMTLLFAFTDIRTQTEATFRDKPYNDFLENTLLKDFPDCSEKTDRGYLPRKMFCQLPDKPTDYREWEVLYEHGKINDLETIPKEVWIQPEFSTAWNGQILQLLQNPLENRFGASYNPQIDNADSGITLSKGSTGRVNFIIRNTPLSIFFLGVKLKEVYPTHESLLFEDININTIQDPKIAKECFDITISPNEFALAPSFPVFVNGEEDEYYTRMISVEIKVSEDCPSGDYIVAVNPTAPSGEFSDEYMLKEFRGKKILTKYSKVGGYIGIGRPFFRTFVTVK